MNPPPTPPTLRRRLNFGLIHAREPSGRPPDPPPHIPPAARSWHRPNPPRKLTPEMPNPSPLRVRHVVLALLAAAVPLHAGCFGKKDRPTPVSSSAFFQPQVAQTEVVFGEQAADSQAFLPGDAATAPPPISVLNPEATLAEQVREIPATPVQPPAPGPRPPAPPVALTGTYMTLGGVLAEVNGVPIFAARVMKELEPVLAVRARQLDARAFEVEARNLIQRTLNDFVSEELEFANASRNLNADDRRLVDNLTTAFRQRRILEAGGSLQNAIRLAAESGDDFDDLVRRENRRLLVGLYYEKKVRPRVSNATTNDMRRFYRENQNTLFTEKTEARFRVIRIDPARHGGKDAALARITEVRNRALAGEDFAELASTANDDAAFARRGGDVGVIARGAFALENVEAAVYRTEPGQITEIVEDRGGFFIAKVESRTIGNTRPFDDPAVQTAIRRELYNQEIARMRRQAVAELEKNALITSDQRMLQTAIEMAMQRYPLWRATAAN